MGNYSSTKAEVTTYLYARTPLIVIHSAERERAERMLTEIETESTGTIYYYTDARQVCSFSGGETIDVDHDPLPYLAKTFRSKRNIIFAIGDIKRIGEDNAYSRELLNVLYLAHEANGTLILITPDPLWSRLAQFGMVTVLDRPEPEERLARIEAFVQMYRGRYPISWETEDMAMAAALTGGFTEIQLDNILSTSLIAGGGLDQTTLGRLTRQKGKLYPAVTSIESVSVSESLEVAGLVALKQWLSAKKHVFFASGETLLHRDLKRPKGVLLAGIPGCGKSYSAKMIARQWGLPLYRFDIGSVYDKWVGESEKKMKEALAFLDNVAPCIVWIDEIEKALAVSDSGSDTGKRIMGQFLFWLQESASGVFLVATANDISLLPPELFRKGRFSEVFFIDLPDERERMAAIAQYAGRSLHLKPTAEEMTQWVALTEGFSYSDIEYSIKAVAERVLLEGTGVIRREVIEATIRSVVPIGRSNPELVENSRKWGRERAKAASGSQDQEAQA